VYRSQISTDSLYKKNRKQQEEEDEDEKSDLEIKFN
jgi:hypothetical protein